ncbi:uncharacterized protein LOC135476823 [Liolophura sinensis]|uniref:uncharacterized protein LOC135476823 n=1 Tax=Liolophura sinensis TaxID=3198878 RepID=UPI0031593AC4
MKLQNISYLRLSGRRSGTHSPSKVNNEKRDKTEIGAYSSCKLKQPSGIDKCQQIEESNIDRDVKYASMSILKARPTRKRAVFSITAESQTHKNLDRSVGLQTSCLDKNANQSKVNLCSSDLTQEQTDLPEYNSKVSKKMQGVLSSSGQLSPNVPVRREHDSSSTCASPTIDGEQETGSDIQWCEPQVKLTVKQSQIKRSRLGTTVEKPVGNDSKESSTKELLEYEVKEKKSLSRELSNLTFSNPGRALADSLSVSVEAPGMRVKRNIPKVSYLPSNSVEKHEKTKSEGGKFKLSSVSRLRLWKEKQASLKRKTISQRNQPFKKKQKITDKVPSILTANAATNTLESTPVNVERPNNSERGTIKPAISDQRQTILRQFDSDCAPIMPMKRKRGRPPKIKRLIRRKAPMDTEIRESNTEKIVVPFSSQGASAIEVVNVRQQIIATSETDLAVLRNLSITETNCTQGDLGTTAVDITNNGLSIISDAEVIDTGNTDTSFIDNVNSVASLTVASNTEIDIIDTGTLESNFTECVDTESSFTDSSTRQAGEPRLDIVDTSLSNSSVNQTKFPVSVSHATAQTDLILPQKMSKKKRKRRSYKGCLDSSFKSKKKISKQQAVNITIPQEQGIIRLLSAGHRHVKDQSATLAENPRLNSTVVEDSVHEEHSYARNSPRSSHLRQITTEDLRAGCLQSVKQTQNTIVVFDKQEDCAPKIFEQSVRSDDFSSDVSLQKPDILTLNSNVQEKSPNNCMPSYGVNSVPFIDSISTENVCVQLESGSAVSESTNLITGKTCEILLIDPITDEEIQQKESEGMCQLTVSEKESCSVSVAFPNLEKDIVANGTEIIPSGESLGKKRDEIKPMCDSSLQSELKGKGEITDIRTCKQDSAVTPLTNDDDSDKCSPTVVRYDGAKENANQVEKTTEAQEKNTFILESSSDVRCTEATKPVIHNLAVPTETIESISCRGRRTETDEGSDESLSRASLKSNDGFVTDTVQGSSGTSILTTQHSTSPLSVLVDEWEDADAPPQLTPVFNNSTQSDELSIELASPPILLASDSCLTPMSDNGLLSREEVPHLSVFNGSKILPSQSTEDQTQSLETSTSSESTCIYPTVFTTTEESGNGCIDDPGDVIQTSDVTELGNIDTAAESKNSGQFAIPNKAEMVGTSEGSMTPNKGACVSMGETEITEGNPVVIPFKRPRGRPRKSKGRKFKAAKPTIFPPGSHKPKTKAREEKALSSGDGGKQTITVTRTFSLRPQVSRSPLENIALRFGGDEAYFSLKKKVKTSSSTLSQSPSQTILSGSNCHSLMVEESLRKHHCKPCSVLLTDFVKQLNLESIDSSDDSDSYECFESGDVDTAEDFFSDANTEERPNNMLDIYSQHGSGASGFKKKQLSPASFLKDDTDQDILATEILEMFANYKCKYCDYCSESSQLMEEHIYIHKEFFAAYPVCCSNCPRRFTDQSTFRDHHIQQHPHDLQRCEVFEAIDEKDHYQIVLRDGSTIDLKMTDIAGNPTLHSEEENISEQSEFVQEDNYVFDSKLNYSDEKLALEAEPSLASFNDGHQSDKCELTTYSPDVEIKKLMQDILDEIENCSKATLNPSLENIDQASVKAVKAREAIQQLPQECNRNDTSEDGHLNQPEEPRSSSQVFDKSPSPITILLSKDGIAEPADGQTEASSLEQSSATDLQLEEASPQVCEKNPDNSNETKAKVDPVVEKLRKIVRSNPPTICTTSSINTQAPTPCESRMPSVLLQTEQAGRKESSVINTPSSTAPFIISVVVNGNVEVSTPDGNITKQPPGTFICTYCTHGADDRSRMVEHVTQMHSDDTQYTCCICDKAFSSKMSVIHQHIKTNHPGQDQQKLCKPLPSFYALSELREHDSVRTKTSDNIFEMFSPVGDTSSSTFEKDEPLRRHFRKARDVMLFREKAKRQAEADSTTSGTGEDASETAHMEIPRPDPFMSSQATQQSISPKSVRNEIQSIPNNTMETEQEQEMMDRDGDKMFQANYQNEDDSCTVTSSEKSAVADSREEKESKYRAQGDKKECESGMVEGKSQDDSPTDDGVSTENSNSDTMLKIVSVVSLSCMHSSPTKDESQKTLSNDDKASGEITREVAQTAVSALFKKDIPSQTVIMNTSCNRCEEVLDSVEDLYHHLQNVHKLTCFYSCPVCSQHMRKSEQGVRQHMLTVHGISDESIQLYITSEKSTETATTDIASSSAEPTGIQCNHCASRYSSAGSLLKHLESVHNEDCLLECPYCKKGISKEETEVYEHINTEHKTYDAFVPLLLVSNRAPAASKLPPKQSLAISESRRQLFASNTMKASRLPLLEKLSVNGENTNNTQSAQAGNSSTSNESVTENMFPSKAPTTADSNSTRDLSSDFSSKPQSSEPQTDSTISPPSLSPLAMLKKTTSSILNEAMSEAASALRPTDSTVNTYTTVFNVQPTPSVVKRIVPIKPKPDAQATIPVYLMKAPHQIPPMETGIPVITQPVPLACQQEKPRPIIPRGIKHVEKRPLKDTGLHSQLAPALRGAQTSGRYKSPSGQTEPQVSHIPPFEPATAISSTVRKPLLRVPSLIPSAAGKPGHTSSPCTGASFTAHQQNPLNQASVAANSPQTICPNHSKEIASSLLPTEEEAPLDLSRPVLTRENLEIEEEVDPDSFNVFNLSPVKQTDSATQPLNLSVKLAHAQGPQNFTPGFRPQVYSHFPETRSTNMSGTRSVTMTRPGLVNMPGARPILGTRHILPMPETGHTDIHGGSVSSIRMEAVGNQMVARFPTMYRHHRPQMDARYSSKSGIKLSSGLTQENPSSGVRMIQRSYQARPTVVANVQRQFSPQSRPRVRHPYPGTSVRSETPGQDLLTSTHAHKLVCPSCDFYTRSPAAMKAHITNVHKARYRCPYCPHLVPLTQRDVPYHIAQQHPDKKLMYFNI